MRYSRPPRCAVNCASNHCGRIEISNARAFTLTCSRFSSKRSTASVSSAGAAETYCWPAGSGSRRQADRQAAPGSHSAGGCAWCSTPMSRPCLGACGRRFDGIAGRHGGRNTRRVGGSSHAFGRATEFDPLRRIEALPGRLLPASCPVHRTGHREMLLWWRCQPAKAQEYRLSRKGVRAGLGGSRRFGALPRSAWAPRFPRETGQRSRSRLAVREASCSGARARSSGWPCSRRLANSLRICCM